MGWSQPSLVHPFLAGALSHSYRNVLHISKALGHVGAFCATHSAATHVVDQLPVYYTSLRVVGLLPPACNAFTRTASLQWSEGHIKVM